nr:diguanylate cyclase [Fredinandcohnia onubensis]
MSKYVLLFRRKTRRIPKYFFLLFFSIGLIEFLDEWIEFLGITFENTIYDYLFDFLTLLLITGPLIFFFLKKIQSQDEILVQQEALLRSILENMEDGVFVCDIEGNLIFINDSTGIHQRVKKNLPIKPHEWAKYWEFYSTNESLVLELEQLPLIRALRGEVVKDQEIILKPKGLEPIYFTFNGKQILDDSGEVQGAMVVAHNITKRKEQDETIRFLAYHDALTGLPNRTYFKEYLGKALSNAKAGENQLAVMFLDLDGFKQINDTFGHDVGDLLLIEVSKKLTLSAGSDNFVTRMGGDEFTLIFPKVNNVLEVERVAEEILEELKKPFKIQGNQLNITSSIGIANYPIDSKDRKLLMKQADLAMYYAKKNGKNNFQLFSNIKEEINI